MQTTSDSDHRVSAPQIAILLVDDQSANLLALEAILSDLGANLVKAYSGEEALRLLADNDFAVILLDVRMHGLDGFETAQRIRAHSTSRHTPIIFLTAYDTDRIVIERAYALGAVDFLVKPLVPVVLRGKIAGFVELFQKTEQVKHQARQLQHMQRQEFERRLAEENSRLHEQREWLRVALGSIGDAVMATDPAGRVVFLNPVAESLTGWKQTEAEGHALENVCSIIDEDTRQPVEQAVPRVIREGAVVGLGSHPMLVSRDGMKHPIDGNVAPIRDGKGQTAGVVLVFRDVTERHQADKAAQRLSAIVESSGDAIASKDLNGIITSWNRGAEQLFGYSAEEMIGQPVAILIPADHADEEPEILRRIRRGDKVEYYETVRQRKDGRLIDISLTVSPIHDRTGRVIGASKIARDISRQKQLENDLRQLAAELSDADRRKNEFMAMLAHELRSPLAPIRNALQITRLSGDADATEQARRMMERQVQKLVRLVDDLLDMNRISKGKLELRREHVDLAQVVQSAVETARPLIEGENHRLTVTLPPHPVYVVGDLTRLAQVVSNLLNNSAKYTPRWGQIHLSVEREGAEAVIRVRDNGMGIAADMLPKVFEIFTQGERALERAQGGLGIGLSLVRQLVDLHGGTIKAESGGPNQGSTFTVRLPRAPGEHKPGTEERTEQRQTHPKPLARRILVVDDNEDAARSLSWLLHMTGNEVRMAHDGPSAVDAAATFRPDVVLLDIGLPGMNGYEVAQRLRGIPELQGAVLIAQTGWGAEDDRRRSEEAGINYHLVKPVDFTALQALMAQPDFKPPPIA
jgi:PAS domain S-box-containing protein